MSNSCVGERGIAKNAWGMSPNLISVIIAKRVPIYVNVPSPWQIMKRHITLSINTIMYQQSVCRNKYGIEQVSF